MSKPKILFCLSRIPYPLEKGDKLRAYQQIKHLAKRYEVYLFVVSHQQLSEKAAKEIKVYAKDIFFYKLSVFSVLSGLMVALFSKFPFQVGFFYNSGALYYFNQIAGKLQPNIVFTQLIRMTEYTKNNTYGKNYLDYMDSFSKGMERRRDKAKGLKRYFFNLEAKRLKNYEAYIHQYYHRCFIISEQDKQSASLHLQKRLEVLPNGVDDHFFKVQNDAPKNYELLFTGNMSYPPNVDAVTFTVKKILPIVWETFPKVKFLIAGASPNAQVKSLAGDLVTVTGWLDDIREGYQNGQIFIAPLQIGTGLQNKLLEAMSMELPCITSALANNALNAMANSEILIADNAKEYAAFIIDLLSDQDLANKLALNGRSFVQSTYNWDAIMKDFD